MSQDLEAKTYEYEDLLTSALETAELAVPPDTPLGDAGLNTLEMAQSYLNDGRHFLSDDEFPTALAAFSYGHGWLDAGARIGILAVPTDSQLFAI